MRPHRPVLVPLFGLAVFLLINVLGCGSSGNGDSSTAAVTVTVGSVRLAAAATSGALADGVESYEVTAQVLDSFGQPISDWEVTFSSHDNSGLVALNPPTAITGADGTATCTVTNISTADDTVNISAASGGVSAAEPIGLAFTGTETSTGIAVGSVQLAATTTTGAKADGTESYVITAQVLDTLGRPISGQAVTFTASGNTGLVALNPPVTTTGADGTATCTVTDINTADDTVSISASAGGVSVIGSIGLAFTGTETSTGIVVGSVQLAATTTTGAKADGTESYVITAQVLDTLGRPISGQAVTFTASGNTGLVALNPPVTTTGADGTATCTVTDISTADDTVTIKASSGGVDQTSPITLNFNGFSGTVIATPAAIDMAASFDSINPAETTEITATVYDASGGIISGVDVLFTLDDPTLAFITSYSTTDAFGEATAILTARNLAGEVDVTATVGSVINDPAKTIIIFDVSAPNQINLTPNPTSILVQGTSSISAEVLDSSSNPVPNGTSVLFEVSNPIYGTVTASALTNSGIAAATFEALNQPGTATINVDSGSASNTVDVEIVQAPASAIEFSSAEPQTISIRESGGVETAIIRFVVKDSNDNPLEGITVSFKMVGPNGGEYIDPTDDGTPDEIDVSTNDQGVAQVTLHSGTVAGPVTISGTIDVDGTPTTVQSSVVSIGGGVPSAKRFSVASDILNLPGLAENNRTASITAYLADRFGNYNVLQGTTVSFISEIGLAIDTSAITLDEDGLATVTVRTQAGAPEDVAPLSWETDLQNDIQTRYQYATTGHPRDGLSSILVYIKGEEHFGDNNANGDYDVGETFIDTTTDPFNDFNNSGDYDDGATDPEELYIDTGNTGAYDGSVNGVWDANKHLFINLPILVTGAPIIRFDINTATFDVANGGISAPINVLVCDSNLNQLTPGSTVTIAADVGKLAGSISREYTNSNAIGPDDSGHLGLIEYTFQILDADATDTDPKEQAVITVTVGWEDITYSLGIAGTVD